VPGISPLFPLLRAHAELLPEPGGEAPEAEVQVQRPTHLMLRPERIRLKQHQLRQPAVVVAVVVAALLLERPTRHLKLLSRR
jgi:hypothetical protein